MKIPTGKYAPPHIFGYMPGTVYVLTSVRYGEIQSYKAKRVGHRLRSPNYLPAQSKKRPLRFFAAVSFRLLKSIMHPDERIERV